jgi:hypothetical protein
MPDLTPRDRAQIGFTMVLQRMSHGRAQNVAKDMGISDSTLSELKTKHAEKVLLLLAHLGLKVVDARAKTLAPAAFEFLTESHQRFVKVAPQLVWGDDESASVDSGFADPQAGEFK